VRVTINNEVKSVFKRVSRFSSPIPNTMCVIYEHGRAMAQAVSGRPLTSETHVGFVVDRVALGQVIFYEVLGFPLSI
jgi:hypothetical protein